MGHALLDAHFTTKFGEPKKKRKDPWGTPLNKLIYALESICCNINKAQHTTSMLSSMLCWMLILPHNLGNQKKKKKRSMGHPLKQAYICIGIDMLQHQQSSTHNIDVEQHALLDAHFTTKFGEPNKKKRKDPWGPPLNKPIYALESTCCNISKAQHTTSMLSNMLCWMLILQQNFGNQKKKKEKIHGAHP